MKRLQVVIDGYAVRFRQTPYRDVIVSCDCGVLCCEHRIKANPEWMRFIRREG